MIQGGALIAGLGQDFHRIETEFCLVCACEAEAPVAGECAIRVCRSDCEREVVIARSPVIDTVQIGEGVDAVCLLGEFGVGLPGA